MRNGRTNKNKQKRTQTHLDDVPVRDHFGEALGYLGTGGAQQHHHSGRVLRVESVKKSIHPHARITLWMRNKKGKEGEYLEGC